MADLEGLKDAVIKGDQDKARQITEAALAESTDPEKIRDGMESTTQFEGVIGTINIDPKTHRPVGLKMSILYFDWAEIKTAVLKYYPKEL